MVWERIDKWRKAKCSYCGFSTIVDRELEELGFKFCCNWCKLGSL